MKAEWKLGLSLEQNGCKFLSEDLKCIPKRLNLCKVKSIIKDVLWNLLEPFSAVLVLCQMDIV